MAKRFLMMGAALLFLSVTLGAFAAHGLKDVLDAYGHEIWRKAFMYQTIHGFALLFVGIIIWIKPQLNIALAGWAFLLGTILFSGSLYVLALSGIKILGAVTPFGGISFLLGWAALIFKLAKAE